MRSIVTIGAALLVLGATASALILAQKGSAQTATETSTVYIASGTPQVSGPPSRAPASQNAQAAGSEASPIIFEANLNTQFGNPKTAVMQVLSAAATAPNVKDHSTSTISTAVFHETTRLKDDATGWLHKLLELELDLKLQLDLKKSQDVEATVKDLNECLVVLRAAADRLAPDAETKVALHKQQVSVRDLAIRAEVHPELEIRKTANFFQQKAAELRDLNRSVEETRTRLVTQIDWLEELKFQLKADDAAQQIGKAVKDAVVSLDNIQAISTDAQRIVADLDSYRRGGL